MLYEGRVRELQAGLAQARLHSVLAGVVLAIGVALFLTLGFYAVSQRVAFWWPALPIPLVAASARRYRLSRQSRYRFARLDRFYLRATERIQGNWAGSGSGGEEFCDPEHVYARDLNVFGEGSLFELLCTARTANGRRGLAEFLLKAPPLEETIRRQEAVR